MDGLLKDSPARINGYGNLVAMSRHSINVVWAEWMAWDKDSFGISHLDEEAFHQFLGAAKTIENVQLLVDGIWNFIKTNKLRPAVNKERYQVCPFGCHTVSMVKREDNDEKTV